ARSYRAVSRAAGRSQLEAGGRPVPGPLAIRDRRIKDLDARRPAPRPPALRRLDREPIPHPAPLDDYGRAPLFLLQPLRPPPPPARAPPTTDTGYLFTMYTVQPPGAALKPPVEQTVSATAAPAAMPRRHRLLPA